LLGKLGVFPVEKAQDSYYYRQAKKHSFASKELLPDLVRYVQMVEREIRSSKNAR